MSQKIKIYGYPEFKSKSSAILQLLKDGKTTKEIKEKIPYCREQEIYYVRKKILTLNPPQIIL